MSDRGQLFMIQLPLETRRLFALGRRRRLPVRQTDLDYLVHCQLGELFGEQAPAPFRAVSSGGREVQVLAYSDKPAEELRNQAETFAEPAAWAACAWDRIATKRMPGEWPRGKSLGFEVRTCPVVRKASEGPKHRQGAEIDVFLSRCWERPGEPVDREAVYCEWLREHFGQRGVTVGQVGMEKFRLARVLRRDHGQERTATVCQRPDALLRGILQIDDGAAFQDLLARGLGRHRAFGFGMVLLRPA